MEIVYPARIVESQSRSTNKRILISTPNLFMPPPVPPPAQGCIPTTLAVDNIEIDNRYYGLAISINNQESKIVPNSPLEYGNSKTVRLPWVLQDILVNAGIPLLSGSGGDYIFYSDWYSYSLPIINFYGNECPPDIEVCDTTTVTIEPALDSEYGDALYRMIAKNGEPRIIMRSCATLYAPGT